jgi:hypothetical protein
MDDGPHMLSSLRLDPFCCLLPYLANFCAHVLSFHHTEVQILGFGVLISALFMGRVAATILPDFIRINQKYTHFILALVFFTVGISSRYIVLMLACFVTGVLKDWSAAVQPASRGSSGSATQMSETKRSLVFASFAIIILGFVYRDNASLPALYPCMLSAGFFFWMSYRSRKTLRKTKFSSLSHHRTADGPPQTKVTPSASLPPRMVTAGRRIDPGEVPESAVPQSYVKMWGSAAAAHKRYVETLQWRQDNGLDTLLARRQRHFRDVLQFYPHAIHGRSLDGCVVLYEALGQVDHLLVSHHIYH